VIKASSASDAVPLALKEVDAPIGPNASPLSTQDVPSVPGVDETTVVTYLSDDNSSAVQVVGQRVGETVYCLIFAGSLDAAAKRSSQIQVIASGFTITSLFAIDLSDKRRAGLTKPLLSEFEAYAQELLTRLEVPGASVAIVANGKIVYAKGFGVKEIGGADPVTADTQMMIGSATKSMTTMMMATEVDDRLMAWDEPVVDILPEFAVADRKLTKTITVRNLVCACTGVPRRDLEFIFNASELSAEDVIASLKGFKFFTGFGEAFQYSNQMVATGGYVAAAAAGGEYGGLYDAYVKQMQERVFDPIGLTRTTLSFDAVENDPDHATPHGANIDAKYEPIPLSLEETLNPVAPAGLVWSSANDMARYLITELQRGIGPDGNRVVSRKNLEETWVPQVAVAANVDYGLGWLVENYHGLRLIHHGGNTLGFTSELAFMPDNGIGIVVLANGQAANAYTEGVRARLLELLYDQPEEYDKLIDYAVEQSTSAYQSMISQIVDVPEDIAGSAIGTYQSDVLGPVVLSMKGDELFLDAGEFSMRLKLAAGSIANDEVTLIAVDPPLAGTPLTIRNRGSGRQELVLDTGTDTYVFKLKRGQATPTVVDGTPIAA
jgi:CubicO group peptidase (beta-lactamase class C family)